MVKKLTIEVKKDRTGEWRTYITAGNGKCLFVSSESYKRSGGAINAINSLVFALRSGTDYRLIVDGKEV